jgi:hypothetical protein
VKRKLKRGVGGSGERWIRLPHYMIKSRAWRSLLSQAKALLIEVWVRHNGVNNGEITFGCSEAEEALDFGKTSAKRMFDILVDRGFLAVVRKAQFRSRWARSWRITAEPYRGQPATKEYMAWRPAENDSPVPRRELTSSSHGTHRRKSDVSVPPRELQDLVPAGSQFPQRNTYRIPSGGCSDAMPDEWQPKRATLETAVYDGLLRWSDIALSVAQFREYQKTSGDASSDWDRSWLDYLRRDAGKGQAEDHAAADDL